MKYLFSIFTIFLFCGCGSQIENFVSGARSQPAASNPVVPNPPTPSSKAIKLSPGAVNSTGAHFQSGISIGASKLEIKGSHFGAKIALSQNRVN